MTAYHGKRITYLTNREALVFALMMLVVIFALAGPPVISLDDEYLGIDDSLATGSLLVISVVFLNFWVYPELMKDNLIFVLFFDHKSGGSHRVYRSEGVECRYLRYKFGLCERLILYAAVFYSPKLALLMPGFLIITRR